jgi:hypothetical protein
MFLLLGLVLLVAWVLGLTVFKVTAATIHLLLILAVVGLVAHFVRGRRTHVT